jgi:DNA-binding GntR family transcriptional regulator
MQFLNSAIPKSALRISLADEAYERLKQDLADFFWAPGDRFTEQEVCDRLQISRTPARQALLRLQQEGHVEVLFRNGWRVLPFDFQRFDQLYDLRLLLESESVERLCEGRLIRDPAKAQYILTQLAQRWLVPVEQRSVDAHEVCIWDEDFHSSLIEATGNAEMHQVHKDITDRIRVIRRLDFTQHPRIEATYEEHGRILQAIRSGRADQTRMLLKAHIETSQLEVRKITLHQIHQLKNRTPSGV